MDLIEERTVYFTYGTQGCSGSGWMKVPLKSFLLESGRGITKAKKLIQYIRESHEPDQKDVIRQFIADYNQAYKDHMEQYEPYMRSLAGKQSVARDNLYHCKEDCKCVKRKLPSGQINPAWKKLNDRVKTCMDDIKELDALAKDEIREHNRHVRDKAFLDKVSKELG